MPRRTRGSNSGHGRKQQRATHHGVPMGTHSYVGWLDISKARGLVPYRSHIDRDALIHLAFDHRVESFQRNDLTEFERLDFKLCDPARANRVFTLPDGSEYEPDHLLVMADSQIIYAESGPHEEKTSADAMARLQAASVEAAKASAGFVLLTDRVMRGRLLDNRRALFGFLKPIACDADVERVARAVFMTSAERVSVLDVLAIIKAEDPRGLPDESLEEIICSIVARAHSEGRLLCDLETVEWTIATKLAISEEPCERSFIEDVMSGQRTAPPVVESQSPRRAFAGERVVEPALLNAASVPTKGGPATDASLIVLSAEERAQYAARVALVRDREAHSTEEWSEVVSRHGFSDAMARYWWSEYLRGGEAELRPRTRFAPPLLAWVREPDAVPAKDGKIHRSVAPIETIEKVIELLTKLYRNSRSQNISQIVQRKDFTSTLRELGVTVSYDSARRFIKRWLEGDEGLEADRRGAKRRPPRPTAGFAYEHQEATRNLEWVEFDAARADIQLVGADGISVVERIWILFAVCPSSRLLWSWLICLTDPTAIDYLRCFERGIRPKDKLCAELGTRNVYPCYGVPGAARHDRGWAFLDDQARERITGFGVDLSTAAPFSPQMKPHVERIIGTVNTRLLHRLPGTTKENPLKRGGRDAVAEALKYGLTVANFERLFDQAIIDGLADELHTGIGCTPLERWEALEKKYGHPRRWPTDPASQLRLSFLAMEDCGVRDFGHGGYQLDNMLYRPERPGSPDPARLLRDPDDARFVAIFEVVGPRAGEYFGEGVVRNLPTDMPISVAEMKTFLSVKPSTRARTAAAQETLADIVNKVEAGTKLRPKEATRFEKALRGARRAHAGRAPQVASPATGAPPALPAPAAADVELELAPAPDFRDPER